MSRSLLALLVAVPALAFAWGRAGGEVVFVLYRQPKLAAVGVLGWAFLAAYLWRQRRRLPPAAVAAELRHPAVFLLALFLGYLALTLLWVRVPANALYELQQYLLLLPLLLVLLAGSRHDPRLARTVEWALLGSLAVATAVGLAQRFVDLPLLRPIDPEIGVPNPSVMGYKNPMALALLGQLFLLGHRVATARGRRRLLWGAVLAAELLYLATLESRTALLGLAAGGVALATLRLAGRPSRREVARLTAALVLVAVAVGAVVAVDAPARRRAATLLPYLAEPASYLDSDRGVYLRNTLEMVRHHPWGVGAGDWQTHYPVFRRHGREVAFNDRHQVRRAHSDHVQLLGEAGWPGLALWLAFLAALFAAPARRHLRTGRGRPLFLAAQVTALAAAMATDYYVEMPYHKLQLFLVAFLALAHRPGAGTAEAPSRPGAAGGTGVLALLAAVTLAANLVYHGQLMIKVHAGATLTQAHLRLARAGPGDAGAWPYLLERTASAERRFLTAAGHTKSVYKDHLVLTRIALLLGRHDAAVVHATRALELHPYAPDAMKLMAEAVAEPELAREWREAYRYVMDEATSGFKRSYPPLPPAAPSKSDPSKKARR